MERYAALIKNGIVINIIVLAEDDRLRNNLGNADKGVLFNPAEESIGIDYIYDDTGFHAPEGE